MVKAWRKKKNDRKELKIGLGGADCKWAGRGLDVGWAWSWFRHRNEAAHRAEHKAGCINEYSMWLDMCLATQLSMEWH